MVFDFSIFRESHYHMCNICIDSKINTEVYSENIFYSGRWKVYT